MQEESTTISTSEQSAAVNCKHSYYEVGRELLSKPNLLCDIVESQNNFPILVFCNTPSDTDFAEVMLKKRGIAAQKLIGNVPQPKLDRAIEDVKNGVLSVIVLTDIAARNIDLSLFKAAVNYSVPADSDTYQERTGQARNTVLPQMITLVTALELANFHYLKKSLGYEPELAEPPSEEAILQARVKNMAAQAEHEGLLENEKTRQLVSIINGDPARDHLIALLLNNTFTVIPALRASAAKAEAEDQDYAPRGNDREGNGRSSDSERGGRSQGGRGRQDRDDYRPRAGNRSDNRGNGSYEGLPRDEESFDEDENFGNRPHDSRRGGPRERGGRSQGRSFDQPIKKDARIYLGVGSAEGVTRETILNALKEPCSIGEEDIKHFSSRTHYTFFDIDDEKSEAALEALKQAGIAKDKNPYAAKAIAINAVVPKDPNAENHEASQDEPEREGNESEDVSPETDDFDKEERFEEAES